MNKYVKTAELSRKEHALRKDVRLLGGILGDTIRDQEGQKLFELVEKHGNYRSHFNAKVLIRQKKDYSKD